MKYNKEMNIYERMSEIENQIGIIEKSMEVGQGKNAYKAVGEAIVLNAVKPLEYEYRVKSLPIKREVVYQDTFEDKFDNYTKRMNLLRITTTYRFINLDNPSDFVDVQSLGDGSDPLDKASGKAQTYADKNALIKAYKMISGEDTDNMHSNTYEEEQQKAYAKSLDRVKKNLPDKLLIEVNGNEDLRRKATAKTLGNLGYKNWNELDLTKVSEAVFIGKFKYFVKEIEEGNKQ